MKLLSILMSLIILVACSKEPPAPAQLPGDLYCGSKLSALLQVKFEQDLTFSIPENYPTVRSNEYCSIAVDEVKAVNQKIFTHFGFKQTPGWREIKQRRIPCYAQDLVEEAIMTANPEINTITIPIEAVLPTKQLPDGRYQIDVSNYDPGRYYPDVMGTKSEGSSNVDIILTWKEGLPPGVYVVTSSLLAIWATVPIVVEESP
ncbi:hypothetical protein JXA59_01745 [Patescibacteria group bacterium]|nr:hypothetical protein [Patescibacteria group bacterium]